MSDLGLKASILAVGTELTTGQILNRNAAWLSEKLTNLGLEVVLHETVPDDFALIEEALGRCAKVSQFLFVTGGLGPTTDDFTRDVIAQWLNQPLEFDEASWERILTRLGGFGVPVAPSNRQQCFFPKGCEVIPNPEGTASGFTGSFGNGQRIWVLPGPPREVNAIWNLGIEGMIRSLNPEKKAEQLLTWQCLGKSEAELGELTEKALEGSQLKTGYRVSRPFVEVKVWVPKEELEAKKEWIQKLEQAIEPWIFTRQGEDLAESLLTELLDFRYITVMDRGSRGALVSRIGALVHQKMMRFQSLFHLI